MLSQFKGQYGLNTLKQLDYQFDENVMPVGRLDYDTEGLLLLTTDKNFYKKINDRTSFYMKQISILFAGIVLLGLAACQTNESNNEADPTYLKAPPTVDEVLKPAAKP